MLFSIVSPPVSCGREALLNLTDCLALASCRPPADGAGLINHRKARSIIESRDQSSEKSFRTQIFSATFQRLLLLLLLAVVVVGSVVVGSVVVGSIGVRFLK